MKPCEFVSNIAVLAFSIIGSSFFWWAILRLIRFGHPVVVGVVAGLLTIMVLAAISNKCDKLANESDDIWEAW